MNNTTFHLYIGKFKCMVISDGTLSPDTSEKPDNHNTDVDHLNCFFIDTGTHKILVDTGCGDGFQSTAGKLLSNMDSEGLKPTDIDTIIFTHGHIDHVGGAFNRKGEPTFPNAHYYTSRKEWEYWGIKQDKTELQSLLFASARKGLLPIPERFDLVGENADLMPGIKFIAAPGHTPGNSLLEITSGNDRLLCIGDIIHSPKEFKDPESYTQFDVTPEQAIQTRNSFLAQAARSGERVFACHFPFPGLGHIEQTVETFGWKPIEISGK